MDRRITVSPKADAHIGRITPCIRVEMTDGNKYFLAESINDFMKSTETVKCPLVRALDVFNSSICVNPNYIKTVREGKCVTVTKDVCVDGKKDTIEMFFVIGSSDTPVLCEPNENNDMPIATRIYVQADELTR